MRLECLAVHRPSRPASSLAINRRECQEQWFTDCIKLSQHCTRRGFDVGVIGRSDYLFCECTGLSQLVRVNQPDGYLLLLAYDTRANIPTVSAAVYGWA
jgi:hypothetical protein